MSDFLYPNLIDHQLCSTYTYLNTYDLSSMIANESYSVSNNTIVLLLCKLSSYDN